MNNRKIRLVHDNTKKEETREKPWTINNGDHSSLPNILSPNKTIVISPDLPQRDYPNDLY